MPCVRRLSPWPPAVAGCLMSEPVPYYPQMPCHLAPLPPNIAPLKDCRCRICVWASARLVSPIGDEPVLPGTPEWDALLTIAGAVAA